MEISEILAQDRIACDEEVTSKKGVLEALARMLAGELPRAESQDIFRCLMERERLGSTGLGKGVALPHARMSNCDQTLGAFFRCAKGIDFDALDGQPVDVFFALLVPEKSTEDHLQTLARLAERFSDAALLEKLRTAARQELYGLLTG
jgi:PTS system nitrogen regulatory IIA component